MSAEQGAAAGQAARDQAARERGHWHATRGKFDEKRGVWDPNAPKSAIQVESGLRSQEKRNQ